MLRHQEDSGGNTSDCLCSNPLLAFDVIYNYQYFMLEKGFCLVSGMMSEKPERPKSLLAEDYFLIKECFSMHMCEQAMVSIAIA